MQVLNGEWKIALDAANQGRNERWFDAIRPEAAYASVPGIIQQVFPGYHGVAWYWHPFRMMESPKSGDRVFVRFGAVDYVAEVWMNGKRAGQFEGGETPFEFDVTDAVRPHGENLLAVRVLNPTEEPIDGYILDQVPHRNKVMQYNSGSSFNTGGIMYPVELLIVPSVRISDIFLVPDCATGRITVHGRIFNHGNQTVDVVVNVGVAEASGEGRELAAQRQKVAAAPGESAFAADIVVAQPRLWDLDDPFLYRVTVRLGERDRQGHERSARCGFRDFRLVDGFFHLNGRRIFLKCSHTGNHVPIGQQLPTIRDHVRRDVINAKSSGFNALRFIAGTAWPEQLDFCDEVGILVIESTYAGWGLGYHSSNGKTPVPYGPVVEERFDHSMSSMVLRDRNHPGVVAWELLNETPDSPILKHARDFLPQLRKLDTTRLVFLNSGRFDRNFEVGSCSNPGSDRWEHVWGAEAPDAAKPPEKGNPSCLGAGDYHLYPVVPHTPEVLAFLRDLGRDTKPVFLSEYGIGSLFDVIGEMRHYQQVGARPDLEDAAYVRTQSERLQADWKRLGFDEVYPFPEDMLRESQRLNARQRTLGFNLIRSNPKLCGFNLTGLLDHGMSGEGLWKFWRDWKPEMFDAVCDGWSPLRWCLFVDPMHGYAGREVTVEAVLATEDVLPPGKYPARFRVFGPDGTVWEKAAAVKIPDHPPLAVPVIRETFKLKGPAGRYTFSANLEKGGAPTGGSMIFHVSDAAELPRLSGSAAVWGIDAAATKWLNSRGLKCRPFGRTPSRRNEMVLVGMPGDANDAAAWEALKRRVVTDGARVLFLNARLFKDNAATIEWLPFRNKGKCIGVWDWLYHKECVANRHPVFAGLQGPGVMDMDYYGAVIPHEVFVDQDTPDETICAGFNTGYHAASGGYRCSHLISLHRAGKGWIVLSTPYLLENLGKHPAADRLMSNLVRHVRGA